MAKEVRIALVMGGGVSLGTFSAGALGQLLIHLERDVATRPAAAADAGVEALVPRIDVFSGASAGAMTAAVALRLLLEGKSGDEVTNELRRVWVAGVGVDYAKNDPRQLLPDMGSHAEPGLLSTRPIRALASRYLLEQPVPAGRGSALLGDVVYLSLAVSNLHGVDVEAPWQLIRDPATLDAGGDALVTTFYDDCVRFKLPRFEPDAAGGAPANRGTAGGAPAIEVEPHSRAVILPRGDHDPARADGPWRLLADSALASGAFPGAFPPVTLLRRVAEYGALWPRDLRAARAARFPFTYLDGGMFRNEPLKEAIELAWLADADDDPESYERVFVLIDPHISGPASLRTLDFETALALTVSYRKDGAFDAQTLQRRGYAALLLSVLGRAAGAVAGQATFRDWMRAAKRNREMAWGAELEALLWRLAALAADPDEAGGGAALAPAAQPLADAAATALEAIYASKATARAATDGSMPAAAAAAGAAALPPAAATAGAPDVHAPDVHAPDVYAQTQLASDRARLAAELTRRGDLDALPNPAAAALARDLVLLLRNAAGTRDKRELAFVAVTPRGAPGRPVPALAGNFLFNFGGFLHQDWRLHDFLVGRDAASAVLTAPIGDARPLLRPETQPAAFAGAYAADPGYAAVPPATRKRFEDALHDHLEHFASAIGVPDFADDLLARILRGRLVGGLYAPAGEVRNVVLTISGTGLDERHRLKPAPRCEPARALPQGRGFVLETVIQAHHRPDEQRPYLLTGPHVLADGIHLLESGDKRLHLRFAADPRAWFEAARLTRFLRVDWEGEHALALAPADLTTATGERFGAEPEGVRV